MPLSYVVETGRWTDMSTTNAHTYTYCNSEKKNKAVKMPMAIHSIKGHSRSLLRINCLWHIKI